MRSGPRSRRSEPNYGKGGTELKVLSDNPTRHSRAVRLDFSGGQSRECRGAVRAVLQKPQSDARTISATPSRFVSKLKRRRKPSP